MLHLKRGEIHRVYTWAFDLMQTDITWRLYRDTSTDTFNSLALLASCTLSLTLALGYTSDLGRSARVDRGDLAWSTGRGEGPGATGILALHEVECGED